MKYFDTLKAHLEKFKSGPQPKEIIPTMNYNIYDLAYSQRGTRAYPYELWIVCGQSNAAGNDKASPILYAAEDATMAGVYELSQGVAKTEYPLMESGLMQLYRFPGQNTGPNNKVSPWLNFCKLRKTINPGIKKICIINAARNGTGFSNNRWNPGDDLFNAAVGLMEQALSNYPEFHPTGILFHGGEIDAGTDQSQYQSLLGNMVSGFRNEIPNGKGMVFICGTMLESWINGNESDRRPIDLAHRNVGSYIIDSACVDNSDLTGKYDFLHFNAVSLREMGYRYAATAQGMIPASQPVYLPQHFKIRNNRVMDVWNDHEESYEHNDTYFFASGNLSNSIALNPEEYTIALRVRHIGTSGEKFMYNNEFSFGMDGFGHGSIIPGSDADITAALIAAPGFIHIALSYDGTDFELYIEGQSHGTTQANGTISEPTTVQLSDDFDFESITILPYAVNEAGIISLYNL